MSKIYSFKIFSFPKTVRYELGRSQNIQGFLLVYEQSCMHKVENLTRIIYASRIIPHNKIVPNWIEANLSIVIISFDSKFHTWSLMCKI